MTLAALAVFRFSPLALSLPFIAAAVALGFGVFFWLRNDRTKAVLSAVAALIAAGVFGPSMISDRVTLFDDRIEQVTGFVWSPTVKGFRYDKIASISFRTERGGRLNLSNEIWVLHQHGGGRTEIDPGDLWDTNRDEILRLLREQGISVRE